MSRPSTAVALASAVLLVVVAEVAMLQRIVQSPPTKTVGPNGLQVAACEDFCLYNGAEYVRSRTTLDGVLICSCSFRAFPDGHRPATEIP